MIHFLRRPRIMLPLIVVLIFTGAGFGIAFALGAIPSEDGRFHGGYLTHENTNERQGNLRQEPEQNPGCKVLWKVRGLCTIGAVRWSAWLRHVWEVCR